MEGIEKVTPLQERILALMLEGLADEEVWDSLGITHQVLESHKQALMLSLDLSDEQELQDYIRSQVEGDDAEPAPSRAAQADERRLRILLRLTLKELLQVASDAEVRARMLQQTVELLGTQDPASAYQESEDLLTVSRELKALMNRVLSEIRGRAE